MGRNRLAAEARAEPMRSFEDQMEPYRLTRRPDGCLCVAVPYRGTALLAQPMFNKGSALCRVYENLSPGDPDPARGRGAG
jgi:hypothetical protein